MRSTPERQQQVGEYFAVHADTLHRLVAHAINAPHALIEDACANAWAILLRRPDITLDRRGLNWLRTVARNEARATEPHPRPNASRRPRSRPARSHRR